MRGWSRGSRGRFFRFIDDTYAKGKLGNRTVEREGKVGGSCSRTGDEELGTDNSKVRRMILINAEPIDEMTV